MTPSQRQIAEKILRDNSISPKITQDDFLSMMPDTLFQIMHAYHIAMCGEGERENQSETESYDYINLVQTCGACPEQYDAFIDGKQVGYLRLRHGYFQVAFPDVKGQCIYTANPDGDGCFTDSERGYYLRMAKRAIHNHILMQTT